MLQESGPVLKYQTKTGLAITPIKMPNLDEDDDDNSSAMNYLKSCKAIEYVRVDGKPGLTLQRGRCRFWTCLCVVYCFLCSCLLVWFPFCLVICCCMYIQDSLVDQPLAEGTFPV